MSRDLATLLRDTAVEPSAPAEPEIIVAVARRRQRRRSAVGALAIAVAVVGLGVGGAQLLGLPESAQVVFPPTSEPAVDPSPEPAPEPSEATFDPATLRPTWAGDSNPIGTFGGESNPLGPVTIGDVVVYASDAEHGIVSGLDAETGAKLWSFDLGAPAGPAKGRSDGGSAFIGPHAQGLVLVSGTSGQVVALDVLDGSVAWRMQTDGSAGPPTIHNDTVYVPISYSEEGDVRSPAVTAVDLRTGDTRWLRRLEEGTDLQWYSPVIAGDVVIVGDALSHQGSAPTSWIWALNRNTGKVVWRADLHEWRQGFHYRPPLVRDGRVFAASHNMLFAFSLVTGKPLWTVERFANIQLIDATDETVLARVGEQQHTFDAATGEDIDPEPLIRSDPLHRRLRTALYDLVNGLELFDIGGDHPYRDASTNVLVHQEVETPGQSTIEYVSIRVVLANEQQDRLPVDRTRRVGATTMNGIPVEHGRLAGAFVSWFDCDGLTYWFSSESSPARRSVVVDAAAVLDGC